MNYDDFFLNSNCDDFYEYDFNENIESFFDEWTGETERRTTFAELLGLLDGYYLKIPAEERDSRNHFYTYNFPKNLPILEKIPQDHSKLISFGYFVFNNIFTPEILNIDHSFFIRQNFETQVLPEIEGQFIPDIIGNKEYLILELNGEKFRKFKSIQINFKTLSRLLGKKNDINNIRNNDLSAVSNSNFKDNLTFLELNYKFCYAVININNNNNNTQTILLLYEIEGGNNILPLVYKNNCYTPLFSSDFDNIEILQIIYKLQNRKILIKK